MRREFKRREHDSCTRARRPRARIAFACDAGAVHGRERGITLNAHFWRTSAGDPDRGPRRDRQLGNLSDDLSILCWYLEALPTHHLPWAGFGLGQPHWPMVDAHFPHWATHSDLEKNPPKYGLDSPNYGKNDADPNSAPHATNAHNAVYTH